jgi:hypothetical protein
MTSRSRRFYLARPNLGTVEAEVEQLTLAA